MSRLEKRTYLITTLIWLLVCAGYNAWDIHRYLSSPDIGGVYDHTLSFCLMILAFFRFPIWVCGLLVIVLIESIVFARYRTNSASDR